MSLDAIKGTPKEVEQTIKYYFNNYLPKTVEHAIVDGLITTNENAEKLINLVKKQIKDDFKIEIVFWKKDIEACLHNDKDRRIVNSTITIENLPFEEPSQELIEKFNIKVIKKKVQKKSGYQSWQKKNAMKDNKLTSEEWGLGGTSGNCWDDTKYSISADPQPVNFKEFDELLEKICPNITFLQYKKIYNNCVTTETHQQSDYYGGSVEYCKFVCDLDKLYQELNVLGLTE